MQNTAYFLGANTPRGFCSLYDDFVHPEKGDFLWVLKGTPGCGKSGFMRRIAAAAKQTGLDTEYIYCSGDPDSLDGVYFPRKRIAYVDGTAPHILEPPLPGAGGAYLDLSCYVNSRSLVPYAENLAELTARYKAQYRHAYGLLSALPALSAGNLPELLTSEDILTARQRARSAAKRNISLSGKAGQIKKRYISAFSGKGTILLHDTIHTLCKRVYRLQDRFSLASCFLQEIADAARERGQDAVLCYDPLAPETLNAVLLPELSLGYAAVEMPGEMIYRHIRLDEIPERHRVQALRGRLQALERVRNALLQEAENSLACAKSLHDGLEALYNPHVDFDGVFNEARRHAEALLNSPDKA